MAKVEELMPLVEEFGRCEEQLRTMDAAFPAQMKAAVLQAAVRGELKETKPPASCKMLGGCGDDYFDAKAQRRKDAKGGGKSPADFADCADFPFPIPMGWKWVKLGEVTTYGARKRKVNAKDVSTDMWLLDLEDIEKGGRLLRKVLAGERKAVGDKTRFSKGDVLYSKLRPYLLKVLIADEDGVCTPEIIPFQCDERLLPEYLISVLKSPYADRAINGETYGVKMPRASTVTMLNLPIPLPPLDEQRRIVAKVEAIFAQIDCRDR